MRFIGSAFIGSVRAEFAKLFSTRMWWVLAIILAVYVAFTGVVIAATFSGILPGSEQDLPGLTGGMYGMVYSVAVSIGYVFPIILGTLAVTGEVRHQTFTPTFLATPRRGTVLAAKLVALLVMGALYGVVSFAAVVGTGAPLLAAGDLPTGLDDPDTWLMFARGVLAMALWAVIGVGVGSLIPSQIAAIVVLLAFTQFIEPILRMVGGFVSWMGDVTRFLPGAAGDALVGASFYSALSPTPGGVLDWWQGGLVLLAFAVVLSVLGGLTAFRRDVT